MDGLNLSNRRVGTDWEPRRRLTFLAGENGSGKSTSLRALALRASKNGRTVVAISNTIHDKMLGVPRKIRVMSPARRTSKPSNVLKAAICAAQDAEGAGLRSISRMLRYCGFLPDVGFRVEPSRLGASNVDRKRVAELAARKQKDPDVLYSVAFMAQTMSDESSIKWVDFDGFGFDSSLLANISQLVFWEAELRGLGLIKRIDLYLNRPEGRLPLSSASSGELVVITSSAYISAMSATADIVLVDEPENSLHPRWQRDYVQNLVAALGYSEVKIVIATHSPMIVMGAQGREDAEVIALSSTFHGQESLESKGLEGVLAEVFHVFTPRNAYLSAFLVRLMNDVDSGDCSYSEAMLQLQAVEQSGLDKRQVDALRVAAAVIEDASVTP